MGPDMNNLEKYINWIKTLTLIDKKTLLYNQLKNIAEAAETLQSAVHIENPILDKVNNTVENYTEDEYIENLIILASSIQNSISDFVLETSNIMNQLLDEN